jgi:hypothetical protein
LKERLPALVEADMKWRVILAAGALAASCLATGCGGMTPPSPIPASNSGSPVTPNPPTPPPDSGACEASKAQWAIGERANADLLERARVAAGAGAARFLRPNQAITLEFSASRLNLGLDAADIVRTVNCG